LISSGSKKEPRCAYLIKAKASHRQRMWTEVSTPAPHLLHCGLSTNPIKWGRIRRVLCPVRCPATTLDCTLPKDKNLTLVPRLGPDINSRACRWELPRSCHHLRCLFPSQRPIVILRSCLGNPNTGSGPTHPVAQQLIASLSAVSLLLTPACPGTK
jgi:hypothetical protein